jgi:alkanesulfonate monooxygenase SsuD/methylene tetrahydromethanopterin reductase-like flavin-dependent oxidoreductase (luciferase family)
MSKPGTQVRRLLERRQALASALPAFAAIVRGSLVTRYRRCGKPTCHCVGTEGHGPAHYLVVTLKPGKTEQILLSEQMLPVARQYLDNYNRWWAALEKVSAVNRRLLRLRVAEGADQKHPSRTKSSRA